MNAVWPPSSILLKRSFTSRKPAKPFRTAGIGLSVYPRNPRRYTGQQFIADGTGAGGHFVDTDGGAPELDHIPFPGLRNIAQVHRQHVHRHPSEQRDALPVDRSGRPCAGMARVTVAITNGHHSHADTPASGPG